MSASRRKKIKRFVVDTNVWISWCINGQLGWLTHYVIQNRLLIYASPLLLGEIKKVISYPKVRKIIHESPSIYLKIIKELVLVKEDILFTIGSPDPNDDYLFCLSSVVNAKALVCGDKTLFAWNESPVKLISKKEFEELF